MYEEGNNMQERNKDMHIRETSFGVNFGNCGLLCSGLYSSKQMCVTDRLVVIYSILPIFLLFPSGCKK